MEAVLKYFSSSRFIISLCIAIAALVVWLLVRQIIHRFADRITSAGTLSGRRQTYLALSLNIVRGLLVLASRRITCADCASPRSFPPPRFWCWRR